MHAITYAVLPGELVIDVGANLGDKAEWFANRGVRVIAVEPQPKLVEALRKRFAKNLLVTVVPKGLAAQPGEMIMNISEDHAISTFSDEWKAGRFRNHTWGTKEKIEVTTLDTLIEQFGHPRYIKIDVEGFERQVISGLSCKVGALSFEFTSEIIDHADQICDRLRALGYSCFNCSIAESDNFLYLNGWATSQEVIATLHRMIERDDPLLWGDIYAA
jgi:FkbM family methyltransferase